MVTRLPDSQSSSLHMTNVLMKSSNHPLHLYSIFPSTAEGMQSLWKNFKTFLHKNKLDFWFLFWSCLALKGGKISLSEGKGKIWKKAGGLCHGVFSKEVLDVQSISSSIRKGDVERKKKLWSAAGGPSMLIRIVLFEEDWKKMSWALFRSHRLLYSKRSVDLEPWVPIHRLGWRTSLSKPHTSIVGNL